MNECFINFCSNGHIDMAKKYLSNPIIGNKINVNHNKGEAFLKSCQNGHIDIVKMLLFLSGNQYVKINDIKNSALVKACSNGHIEIIKLLLSLDGERYIDFNSDYKYDKDSYRNLGQHCLILACLNGYINIACP